MAIAHRRVSSTTGFRPAGLCIDPPQRDKRRLGGIAVESYLGLDRLLGKKGTA
jgi:hypothetical protein